MSEQKGWKDYYKKTFPWFPFNEPLTVLSTLPPQEYKLDDGTTVYIVTTKEKGSMLVYKRQMEIIAETMLYENDKLRKNIIDVVATKAKIENRTVIDVKPA